MRLPIGFARARNAVSRIDEWAHRPEGEKFMSRIRMARIVLFLFLSASLGCIPLAQGGLMARRDTSLPGNGVIANISHDGPGTYGSTLFQVCGASIVELDLDVVRTSELSAPYQTAYDGWNAANAGLPTYPIEASVMKVINRGNAMYVAGGDQGLWGIDRSKPSQSPTRIFHDSVGRWCFDVEFDDDTQTLVTLWAALEDSCLRVFDATTLGLIHTVALDMPHGTGYALELHGDYAYIAMGAAGIVRVDFTSIGATVEPGPDYFLQCVSDGDLGVPAAQPSPRSFHCRRFPVRGGGRVLAGRNLLGAERSELAVRREPPESPAGLSRSQFSIREHHPIRPAGGRRRGPVLEPDHDCGRCRRRAEHCP